MSPDELHLLLRLRGEALAPPAEVIDRALARCARIGVRQSTMSGRQAVGSVTTPTYATAPIPAALPTLPTAAGAVSPVTVPSLSQQEPAAPVPAGTIEPGRIIAGYRIESLLGKGGMGAVYRATQLSMNRPVAFKVLAPRLADDPTFVGRFKREARAAGRLHHHHLVTVHDSGEADGIVFFSMELVEGRSLKDVLRERGPLPPDEVLRLARQVLEALAYAHGKGVIHRDIKPDNIMLTATGEVKVADLGLSRIDERTAGDTTELFRTSVGSFMGTPHYMAPEQGRDAHAADHRCDLYALGATLFHLACGRQPFLGATPMEVLVAAQTQPLVWPEPPPPRHVCVLIAALMAKDPADRPADATAAIRLIDAQVARLAIAALPRPSRRPALRRLLVAGLVLALLAGMALVVLPLVRERQAERRWQLLDAEVQREAESNRFATALERLRTAHGGMPAGSRRAAACAARSSEIERAWDAWAAGRIDEVERRFRTALKAGDFTKAKETLDQVEAAWLSPAASARLDALRDELFEGMARAAAQKSDPETHDAQRRRAEMWAQVTAEPRTALQVRDGGVRCTGTGSARAPGPGSGLIGGMGLILVLRGRLPADGRFAIRFAEGSELVVTSAGAGIAGQALVPDKDGVYTFGLIRPGQLGGGRRGHDGLILLARGRNGPLRLPLPAAGSELNLAWKLGEATVELRPGGLGLLGR